MSKSIQAMQTQFTLRHLYDNYPEKFRIQINCYEQQPGVIYLSLRLPNYTLAISVIRKKGLFSDNREACLLVKTLKNRAFQLHRVSGRSGNLSHDPFLSRTITLGFFLVVLTHCNGLGASTQCGV